MLAREGGREGGGREGKREKEPSIPVSPPAMIFASNSVKRKRKH